MRTMVVITVVYVLLTLGIFTFTHLIDMESLKVNAQSYQQITPTPSPFFLPTPNSSPPAVPPSNAFNYTPLPLRSPRSDITESTPLSASRPSAQVDDSITFTVGIQNGAPYNKTLYQVCFESTDGNFGCQWGIKLAPGQTYQLSNVGTWTSGGTKRVWITWSQDGLNYYTPLHAHSVTVNIIN